MSSIINTTSMEIVAAQIVQLQCADAPMTALVDYFFGAWWQHETGPCHSTYSHLPPVPFPEKIPGSCKQLKSFRQSRQYQCNPWLCPKAVKTEIGACLKFVESDGGDSTLMQSSPSWLLSPCHGQRQNLMCKRQQGLPWSSRIKSNPVDGSLATPPTCSSPTLILCGPSTLWPPVRWQLTPLQEGAKGMALNRRNLHMSRPW